MYLIGGLGVEVSEQFENNLVKSNLYSEGLIGPLARMEREDLISADLTVFLGHVIRL